MRPIKAVGVLVAVASVWTGPTASAAGGAARHKRKPKPPAPLVLHPRFHQLATGVTSFATDGRYVVVADPNAGTLIDDQSGHHTTLSPPPLCGFSYQVGGGGVLTSCVGFSNPPFQLYSIATGTWTPVPSDRVGGSPVGLGSEWIEYYGPTESGCSEHCVFQYTFGNIANGQIRTLPSWKPGGTRVPGLSSSGLNARLCSPLRVPQGFPMAEETPANASPGELRFAGPFATGVGWFVQRGMLELRLLLERCGMPLHQVLTTQISSAGDQFAINHQAVVWLNYHGGPAHGVFLPSLRSFTIMLPQGQGRPVNILLTSRMVYMETGAGNVVAATSPLLPRR